MKLKDTGQQPEVDASYRILRPDSYSAHENPWLRAVETNIESSYRYPIGFYRLPNGQIATLTSHLPEFRSLRQIESNMPFIMSTPNRRASLLSPVILSAEAELFANNDVFSRLPGDLQKIFSSGSILVTGKHDYYSDSFFDKDKMTVFDDLPYLLLHYSDSGSEQNGRSAILMVADENRSLHPLIVMVDGMEYIVELKGCGVVAGGYGSEQFRSGRDIISGSLEPDQARREFETLMERPNNESGLPLIAAYMVFGDKGYVVRLSPSSIRASYTDHRDTPPAQSIFPDIDEHRQVEKIIQFYATEFVDMLFSEVPRVMNRSSHTENILIWGQNDACFTDYSDQTALNSDNLPAAYPSEAIDFIDIPEMIKIYFGMLNEIPGYNPKYRKVFINNIQVAFFSHGYDFQMDESTTDEELAKLIYQKCVAFLAFKMRKSKGYFPSSMYDQQVAGIAEVIDRLPKDVFANQEYFIAYVKKCINDLQSILSINEAELDEEIITILSLINEGAYLDAINKLIAVQIAKYQRIQEGLPDDVNLFQAIFKIVDISKFTSSLSEYLDNEAELISNALESKDISLGEREYAEKILATIRSRQQKIDQIWNPENLGLLHGFVNNKEFIKNQFRLYT